METILGIFSEEFWYISMMLVACTTALSGLINQGLSVKKSWAKQLISWVIGTGLSVGAWALKLMTFGEPVWLSVTCLCIIVGLASNGFYDIPVIRGFIDGWFKKEKA